jgi:hypothetical protein
MSISALLIPADEGLRIRRIIVAEDGLADLQAAVEGSIEAIPYYAHDGITAYINESGKFECEANRRATQLLGPGLFAGDYIAGNLVVCGFDPSTGENLDCPEWFEARLGRPRVLQDSDGFKQGERSTSREWALAADADGHFSIAVLLVTFEPPGVDVSSVPHGHQFAALLGGQTRPSRPNVCPVPGDFDKSLRICREEVPDFSRRGLDLFSEDAIERLRGLYAISDPRVTRFFRLASGAAL